MSHFKKGITILEIMIVLAIIGTLVAVVVPQFAKSRELQVLNSGGQDILSVLEKARTQTLSSLNSSEYGVHFESDKIILFTGKVFSSSAPSNETIDITSPAAISNVTLDGVSGTSGEIYFNRLSGAPSKTGTLTLSTSSYLKIITISPTGVASIN